MHPLSVTLIHREVVVLSTNTPPCRRRHFCQQTRFTATVVITEMAACRIHLSEEGRRTPVCNSLVLMCFSEKHFVVYLFY